MKVEIDLPDLTEVFYSCYEDESFTCEDLKKAIVEKAIDAFIERLYMSYVNDAIMESIRMQSTNLVKTHAGEIVDKVVNNVTTDILKKKAIVAEMPKKSEVKDIDKEWEEYFSELIDKAIARRFK